MFTVSSISTSRILLICFFAIPSILSILKYVERDLRISLITKYAMKNSATVMTTAIGVAIIYVMSENMFISVSLSGSVVYPIALSFSSVASISFTFFTYTLVWKLPFPNRLS